MKILKIVLGGLIIFCGVVRIGSHPISSIGGIIIGLCFFPQTWEFLSTKIKRPVLRKEKIATVIIVLILTGVISGFSGVEVGTSAPTTVPSEKPISDRKVISIVFAKNVIEKILKSPSTAKFVDVKAYELSNEKDVWAVNGYVDSQNSFGAMIRSQWEVQLDYRDGKGGTVKSILFDGKKMQ